MSYFGYLERDLDFNPWGYNCSEFSQLLSYLYDLEFVSHNHLDDIRKEKIEELRDDFFYEQGDYSCNDFMDYPTVLELMVSMCYSMEDVMRNSAYGNRTGEWFWMMIINLGLEDSDNDNFDAEYARKVIERWIEREFNADGVGSPFPLREPPCDLRGVDIWRMFLWYVNENYQGRW